VPKNCDVEKIPIARPLLEALAVLDNKEGRIASTVLNATKKMVKVMRKTEKFKFEI
jgi:hypothetical protein